MGKTETNKKIQESKRRLEKKQKRKVETGKKNNTQQAHNIPNIS